MPYFLKSTSVNKYNVTNYAKKKKKIEILKQLQTLREVVAIGEIGEKWPKQ